MLKTHQHAVCMNCSYKGLDFKELRKHCLEFHEDLYNVDPSKCNACNFSANSPSETMVHIMIAHGGEHNCLHCMKNLKGVTYLRKHVDRYHMKKFDYHCQDCNKDFWSKHNLDKHNQNCHTVIKEYMARSENCQQKCRDCRYVANKTSLLRIHQLKVHQLAICMNCNYQGNSFKELRNHCFEFHKSIYNIEPSSCHLCEFSAHSQKLSSSVLSATMIHIMTVHGGDRSCSKCNKSFKNLKYLRKHIDEIHLKKIKNKCEECNKGFWRESELDRHNKMYHLQKAKSIVPIQDGYCSKC